MQTLMLLRNTMGNFDTAMSLLLKPSRSGDDVKFIQSLAAASPHAYRRQAISCFDELIRAQAEKLKAANCQREMH